MSKCLLRMSNAVLSHHGRGIEPDISEGLNNKYNFMNFIYRLKENTKLVGILLFFCGCFCFSQEDIKEGLPNNNNIIPALSIENEREVKKEFAFHMAMGDVYTNIRLHKSGLLQNQELCFMAGLNYNKPWTRDAAINTWNAGGLLFPSVAKNTLLSALTKNSEGEVIIDGQYWDKVIWTVGAWNYYLYTGDKEMLKLAYEITKRTLRLMEDQEFDAKNGLFRGAAVYGDGVAAYPEIYTRSKKGNTYSAIMMWPEENPDLKASTGYGLPMQVLSTNCLYYQVYKTLDKMAAELGENPDSDWNLKAEKLKTAINNNLWNSEKQTYDYFIDPFNGSGAQEGMGLSFAIMFDVADSAQIKAIFENTYVEPAGIPVVWPSFPRYINEEKTSYGRHSGTVWPHVQGFWAYAAALNNRKEIFLHEFNILTDNAWRDKQFVEIYHPKTGEKYGGIQENPRGKWNLTSSQNRQTWSATAYLRMVLMGVMGMRFDTDGIDFKPMVPEEMGSIYLENIRYRDAILNLTIKGSGNHISSFMINGNKTNAFIPSDIKGIQNIQIIME
ncbi:hypothetical protein RM553_07975 [Zunongwangia sp. F363]|uniref:Mannosylglycerate hydrolase MGH1-like glycoside hydrolase domain-containing protein n=1 Tax=Autumnicola tepida TaxID=3075595 RepID=A0ABU3C8X0_9FLAO|nr:hypothetical protein [Zunongwangia sp. F363]MDT0642767.1 hypothetical protein [Zunongwangia sp. F363]